MNPGTITGKASISFSHPVYIQSCASVVGPKEGNGPLKSCFDMICEDPMFGEKKWEAAESTLQKEAATLAIGKAGLTPENIQFVFAGDLLAQTIASSFGIAEMGIPFFGLYGACSTMGESLSLGAVMVSAGYGSHILCATSSHFATAEKEFRFPLGYGSQRPLSATCNRYRKWCMHSRSHPAGLQKHGWCRSPPKQSRIRCDHRYYNRQSRRLRFP